MRAALAACAVVAAIGAVAALVVLGLNRSGVEPSVAPPAGDPVVLVAAIQPAASLAGDRLTADLTVTVDRTRVDPASVEVGAFFRPFQRVEPTAVERTDAGDTTVIRFRYPIQCLVRGCAVDGSERTFELPIGIVRYTVGGGDVVSLPLTWPSPTVGSRLEGQTRTDARARPAAVAALEGDQVPPLVPQGRATAIGWGLIAAAALVLAGAAALVALGLRRRGPEEARVEERPGETSLASALRALDEAGDVGARRVALDAVALELERGGRAGLARDARRLAWSEEGPRDEQAVLTLREAAGRATEAA